MKKLIQNLSFIVLLLMCTLSYGQNNMEDVVYLKNGSIIRGIIIEQVPNQSIKIQTKDRNVFVFKFDEIEKLTKENLPLDNSKKSSQINDFKKRGYINITEINYCPGIGSSNSGNYSLGFRTVNGYQLNEYLSLGIGLGIDANKIQTLLPITFDLRATILKGIVSPVFNVNIGYAYLLNNKNSNYYSELNGGLIINPSFGIKTYISKNTAFLFNIGYKMQWTTATIDLYSVGSNGFITTQSQYQFLSFNTGFSF